MIPVTDIAYCTCGGGCGEWKIQIRMIFNRYYNHIDNHRSLSNFDFK